MVTEHMRGVTRHLGQVALREKEHAQMKKLIAVAGLGAALTIGSIGGVATPANASTCPFGTILNPVRRVCECPLGSYWDQGLQTCQSPSAMLPYSGYPY